MVSRDDILAAIAAIVRQDLDLQQAVGEVSAQTPLFDGGLELDSFNVVELITRLEERFGFEFLEEDFVEEHFVSAGALAALIGRYLGNGD